MYISVLMAINPTKKINKYRDMSHIPYFKK